MNFDYFVCSKFDYNGEMQRNSLTISFPHELNRANFWDLKLSTAYKLAEHHNIMVEEITGSLFIEQVNLLNVGEVFAAKNVEKNEVIARMQKAYDDLLQENAELRQRNKNISVECAAQGWWAWQPEGPNNLDSLTCPVLISANDLRQLLLEMDSVQYNADPRISNEVDAKAFCKIMKIDFHEAEVKVIANNPDIGEIK